MSIKDLPSNERPREKLKREGVSNLSNLELLAILIGSGTKGHTAIDIAYDLIKDNGLYNLLEMPYQDFKKIDGISDITAMKLASFIELTKRMRVLEAERNLKVIDENFILDKYVPIVTGLKQEIMAIIILNKKKELLHEKILYRGTRHNIQTSFKDIYREMVLHDGTYFYVVHNHPNGDSTPSDKDILFTTQLIKESKSYGYILLDHIIIGQKDHFSFMKNSLD